MPCNRAPGTGDFRKNSPLYQFWGAEYQRDFSANLPAEQCRRTGGHCKRGRSEPCVRTRRRQWLVVHRRDVHAGLFGAHGSTRRAAQRDDDRNDLYRSRLRCGLTASARKRFLYHVEAGVKIHDLYTRLEKVPGGKGPDGNPWGHGYALPTLGGSGGQSIVGRKSRRAPMAATMTFRPLPDMVQGIHLRAGRRGRRVLHPARRR